MLNKTSLTFAAVFVCIVAIVLGATLFFGDTKNRGGREAGPCPSSSVEC